LEIRAAIGIDRQAGFYRPVNLRRQQVFLEIFVTAAAEITMTEAPAGKGRDSAALQK
jgi:hypothetical protein